MSGFTVWSAAAAVLLLHAGGWLPGCGRGPSEAAPAAPIRAAAPAPDQVLWRVKTTRKVVAITLDDGPNPKYTPAVLRLARERQVKLTFFLLGREVERHPDLARQEVKEGHAVGNHGWDHHLLTEGGENECISQIKQCERAVARACKVKTGLFRPPKGHWNGETFLAVEQLGYRMVLWTIALEHKSAKTPQEMADRVICRISPGMIVLAHDGEPRPPLDRRKTLAALPLLIEGLRKKGYEFITVPELIELSREEHK